MRPGDPSVEIGDGGDHRRPGLGSRASIRPAIALGMEAEVFRSRQRHDAALAQIGFRERARNRLRHGEQPPRGFRRSRPRQSLPAPMIGLRPRQRQKPPGFIDDVVETDKAAALADDVEQIAMFTRRRIGLMFNCT